MRNSLARHPIDSLISGSHVRSAKAISMREAGYWTSARGVDLLGRPDFARKLQEAMMEFSAQVSALAMTAGASAKAKYENGIMVFSLVEGGLMCEGSVSGPKFKYKAY